MWQFAKGHATLNDFVLLTDPDDERDPTPEQVRFLCDRRAGVGGDGVLRAVRASHIPEWTGAGELWFMDYRNADGSLAEMCGNGLRVFARYLVEQGLAPEGEVLEIGTRAGLRTAQLLADGQVRVWMGRPAVDDQQVTVRIGPATWLALPVDVGNPHAVAVLEPGDELAGLDLADEPEWTPRERFPGGVNCEFVHVITGSHVRMRVYERGVGETKSCGTGTVAVAAVMARRAGVEHGDYRVDVPGGRVLVSLTPEGAYLTGPAVVVARGTVELPSLAARD